MTETGLAMAVKAALEEWTHTDSFAQRRSQLEDPSALSNSLGQDVLDRLSRAKQAGDFLCDFFLRAPFRHLSDVFDSADIGDTPTQFFPIPDTEGTLASRAAALALHGALAIESISYGSENDGHLFVNLVAIPDPGALGEKSKKGMRGHTDGVSFPFPHEDDADDPRIAPAPDFVTLMGLRNRRRVATTVIPVSDVLAQLSSNDIVELSKPQYSIRSQKTFIQGMKKILQRELVVIDTPILKPVGKETLIRYSHSNVQATVEGGPAEMAARNLEKACIEATRRIVMQPGDVLVINNRLSLHGREEVGEDTGRDSRWLLRTYGLGTQGLPNHKRHLNGQASHVLFP